MQSSLIVVASFTSIILCIHLFILQVSGQEQKPDTNRQGCRTTYDEVGVCTPEKECPEVINPNRTKEFTVCHWIKGKPIFCCVNPTAPGESNSPGCGTRGSYRSPIIMGGTESQLGTWPWMASISTTNNKFENFLCGATIINGRHLVTSAHPFRKNGGEPVPTRNYLVRVGSIKVKEGTQHLIDKIIVHPLYDVKQDYEDIAVIRLQEPMIFTSLVRPICLPTAPDIRSKNLADREVTITGWGNDEDGGRLQTFLHEATIKVVNESACRKIYESVSQSRIPKGINPKFICAGVPEGGKDACQHDSGGPLMLLENSVYVMVGVVSFGYGCGRPGYPGVYTRISAYVNWLVQVASEA